MINKYFLIISIVIIAIFLRFYKIDQPAIWYDEQVSILIANGQNYSLESQSTSFSNLDLRNKNTLSNVIEATINDNGNSLAYNILLHYWLIFFGNSCFTARALSAVFSLLIIPVGYFLSKKISQHQSFPFLIMLLLAVHPIFVGYSQEARSYMMGTFLSFISSYYFFLFISEKQKFIYYFNYTIFFILSLLTHYLTIYVFIGHFIIVLLYVRNGRHLLYFLYSGTIVSILFYTWLVSGGFKGFEILERQNEYFIHSSSTYQEGDNTFFIPATFNNIVTGATQVMLRLFGNSLQNVGFRIRELFMWLSVPFFLLALLIVKYKFITNVKFLNILLIMSFTHIFFVTYLALKSNHCISFQPPYGNFAAPYVTLLIGYATIKLMEVKTTKKISLTLFFVISFTMIISTLSAYSNKYIEISNQNSYYNFADDILNKYKKGDTLVLKSFPEAQLINLHLTTNNEIIQTVDSSLKNIYEIR